MSKPFTRFPEPFLLLAGIVWLDLLMAAWPHSDQGSFRGRAFIYGVLLLTAAGHSWLVARQGLWSQQPWSAVGSLVWFLVLSVMLWIVDGRGTGWLGLLAFFQISQCSLVASTALLRLVLAVALIVMLTITTTVPLVPAGLAWLAFMIMAVFLLTYDTVARKAGPTGYARLERRRVATMVVLAGGVVLGAAALFSVTPSLQMPDWEALKQSVARMMEKPPLSSDGEVDPYDEGATLGFWDVADAATPIHSPAVIMKVSTEPRSAGPIYLRGQAFDTFDGERWSNSQLHEQVVAVAPGEVRTLAGPPQLAPARSTGLVARFELLASMHEVVFTVARPEGVRFQKRTELRIGDNDTLRVSGVLPRGSTYDVIAASDRYSGSVLARASDMRNDAASTRYLQLPEDLPDDVRQLTLRVVARSTTPWDRAVAIEQFLRENYLYSLDHDVEGPQVVPDFLFRAQRGHCALFASSMVMMARSVGVPARYVTGFVATEPAPGGLLLRARDAHAWVEVHVAGVGWIPFDPTASRDDGSMGAGTREPIHSGVPEPRGKEIAGLYGREGHGASSPGPGQTGADRRGGGTGTGNINRSSNSSGGTNGRGRPTDRGAASDGDRASGRSSGGTSPGVIRSPDGSTDLPRRGDRAGGRDGTDRVTGNTASGSKANEPPKPDLEEERQDWWWLVIVLAVVGVAGLVGVLGYKKGVAPAVKRRRVIEALPLELEDDPDPRRFIVKLYHTMGAGLAKLGLVRASSDTPTEYAQRVAGRCPNLGEHVGELTELFHSARYGDVPVGVADAGRARGLWGLLVTAFRSEK
jgi:hypothetical protein